MFITPATHPAPSSRSPFDGRRGGGLVLVGEHGGNYEPSAGPIRSPEPAAAPEPAAPQQQRWEPWKAAGDTLDAVGRLERAVDGLADADLDALGDTDLIDVTLRLERAGNRLAAQQSKAL